MTRNPVKSTNIVSVGYDRETAVKLDGSGSGVADLEVEFQRGAVYVYHKVPWALYDTLMFEASKENGHPGSFFAKEIKPKYACTKVS